MRKSGDKLRHTRWVISSPVLWGPSDASGNSVANNLENAVGFSNGAGPRIIAPGTPVNPTSVATFGNKGDMYLNNSTGSWYQKQDSGTTTNWVAVAVGNPVTQAAFRASYVGTQSVGSGSATLIQWDTVNFDTSSSWNSGSFYWSAPFSGYFFIQASLFFNGATGGSAVAEIRLYVNGSEVNTMAYATGTAIQGLLIPNGSLIAKLNAGDQVSFYAFQNSGLSVPVAGSADYDYVCISSFPSGAAGVTTVGAFSGSSEPNGASISGSTITFGPADTTNPGMISTGAQILLGQKTFVGPLAVSGTSTVAFTVNFAFVVDDVNTAIGIGLQPATNVLIDGLNTSGASKAIQVTSYGTGSSVPFRGRFARGTVGSPAAAQLNDLLAVFSGRGYGTSQFATASTGAINVVANETFSNTSNATFLQFDVTPTGSVTTAEAMRLNSTGNLLIGTTTDSGTQKLQVNGNSNVGTVTAGVWNGTVTAGQSVLTSGTTYTTPSGITTATRFKFTLVGAGGGGGGINTAADTASGGGGGAAVVVYAVGLSPSTAYTIAIGSGGSGGISVTTPANAGGATTLTMSSITYTAGGGAAGADTASTNGGAGGTATNTFASGFATGGYNIPGQAGNGSTSVATSTGGGGGMSGMGMGLGGASVSASGTGMAGSGFGGGGGGGKGVTSTGGAGTGGAIIVEWNN